MDPDVTPTVEPGGGGGKNKCLVGHSTSFNRHLGPGGLRVPSGEDIATKQNALLPKDYRKFVETVEKRLKDLILRETLRLWKWGLILLFIVDGR